MDAARTGAFQLITSAFLLQELEDVLLRPKFERYITPVGIVDLLHALRQASVFVDDPQPRSVPATTDPDDEYLVALAEAANVDVLVSGDPHVLRASTAVRVVTPREFLDALATT
jgi:putative PIN family toxin of toxin-antitoxin system